MLPTISEEEDPLLIDSSVKGSNTQCPRIPFAVLYSILFVSITLVAILSFYYFGTWKPVPEFHILYKTNSVLIRPKANATGQKTVLFWTGFFNDKWESHFSDFGGTTLPGGNNGTCWFTTNRSYLDTADAVVFHGRDINFEDLPTARNDFSRWVFYLLESPLNSHLSEEAWKAADLIKFDWVMSYSTKAHVWIPYCHAKHNTLANRAREVDIKLTKFSDSFHLRQADAVWLVSNCHSVSRREELAERLKTYGVTLDSWGHCSGKLPEQTIRNFGEEAFYSRYRFYFAAENSLCQDYATEKFGRSLTLSLNYGLIPLVYGSDNYSRVAPPGSYIDADKYESVEKLAEHLKMLKKPSSKQAVYNYLSWSKSYILGDCKNNFPRFGFSNLCQKLFIQESIPSGVRDIRSFLGECREPSVL